jgi:hypothetical protein
MADIINKGTATFTTGSTTITFTDADFYNRGVVAGHKIKRNGEPNMYTIAQNPTDNTTLIIQEPYGGISGNDSFQIFTDIDGQFGIVFPSSDQRDLYDVLRYDFQRIIDELAYAGAPAIQHRITQRFYLGEPVEGKVFGYLKWSCNAQIDNIAFGTDGGSPDNPLALDININGVAQNVNLSLPAGNNYIKSSDLTLTVSLGDYTECKWTSVTLPAGSNYFCDIIWHPNSPQEIRYDFNRFWLGDLQVNGIIGNGWSPPVKSKFFGLSYTFVENPEGSDVILELYKDNNPISTPVTIVLPEGIKSGYIPFTQTDFLTTNTLSLHINQVGSTIPGSNLEITLHSYRIE